MFRPGMRRIPDISTGLSQVRGSMTYNRVFIVSGDAAFRDFLTSLVATAGLVASAHSSLQAWIEAAAPEQFGCLVLDAGVDELSEPERRARFAAVCARMPVVVLTQRGDIATAVHAVRQGAAYVLQKSHRNEILLEYIHRALAAQGAERASC
jgi:two-component system response regulator FixJ